MINQMFKYSHRDTCEFQAQEWIWLDGGGARSAQMWEKPLALPPAADRMFTLMYNEGKLNLLAPSVPWLSRTQKH